VFESDFASTDEDAAQDDEEAGEKVLQDEEKRAKRVSFNIHASPVYPMLICNVLPM